VLARPAMTVRRRHLFPVAVKVLLSRRHDRCVMRGFNGTAAPRSHPPLHKAVPGAVSPWHHRRRQAPRRGCPGRRAERLPPSVKDPSRAHPHGSPSETPVTKKPASPRPVRPAEAPRPSAPNWSQNRTAGADPASARRADGRRPSTPPPAVHRPPPPEATGADGKSGRDRAQARAGPDRSHCETPPLPGRAANRRRRFAGRADAGHR
jgi:hypothetical protein